MTDRGKQIEEMTEIIDYTIYQYGSNPYPPEKTMSQCIASDLVYRGYRKMDEVTLKLDLGDRTPKEIKQIAEVFSGEIKKQVAKEIFEELRANEEANPEDCDCWLVAVEGEKFIKIAKKYGVELEV